MFVLAVSLAVLVGLCLGTLGGGGSLLTMPILLYVLHLPARQAIATSLLVVGTTSLAALVPHARAGRVRWPVGATFGAAGMLGSFLAGKFSHFIDPRLLLVCFGFMMLLAAGAMLRGRRNTSATSSAALPLGKVLAQGLFVGGIAGLVGAGGGFLVVPALSLWGGLAMESAVGTSLVVVALQSLAGFAGHVSVTPIDWPTAAAIALAAVVGSVAGARLAGKIAPDRLRRGFGWFVVAMAVLVLGQQVPELFGIQREAAAPYALVGALVAFALGMLVESRRKKAV